MCTPVSHNGLSCRLSCRLSCSCLVVVLYLSCTCWPLWQLWLLGLLWLWLKQASRIQNPDSRINDHVLKSKLRTTIDFVSVLMMLAWLAGAAWGSRAPEASAWLDDVAASPTRQLQDNYKTTYKTITRQLIFCLTTAGTGK